MEVLKRLKEIHPDFIRTDIVSVKITNTDGYFYVEYREYNERGGLIAKAIDFFQNANTEFWLDADIEAPIDDNRPKNQHEAIEQLVNANEETLLMLASELLSEDAKQKIINRIDNEDRAES